MLRLIFVLFAAFAVAFSYFYQSPTEQKQPISQFFVASEGRLGVVADNHLLFIDKTHQLVDRLPLDEFGIQRIYGDVFQLSNGDIIVSADKRGTDLVQTIAYQLGFNELVNLTSGVFRCDVLIKTCRAFGGKTLPTKQNMSITQIADTGQFIVHFADSQKLLLLNSNGDELASWESNSTLSEPAVYRDAIWVAEVERNAVRPINVVGNQFVVGAAVSLKRELGTNVFNKPMKMAYSGSEWWVIMHHQSEASSQLAIFSREFDIGAYSRLPVGLNSADVLRFNGYIYLLKNNLNQVARLSPGGADIELISLNDAVQGLTVARWIPALPDYVVKLIGLAGFVVLFWILLSILTSSRGRRDGSKKTGWLQDIQKPRQSSPMSVERSVWVPISMKTTLAKYMSEIFLVVTLIGFALLLFKLQIAEVVLFKSEMIHLVIKILVALLLVLTLIGIFRAHQIQYVRIGVKGGRLLIKNGKQIEVYKANEIHYTGDEIIVGKSAFRFKGVYQKAPFMQLVAPILQLSKVMDEHEVRNVTGRQPSFALPMLNFLLVILVAGMFVN